MKQFLSLFLLAFALFISSQKAEAVQAYPHPVEYKLPDGSFLTIILKGDEKVRWATTSDGYTILRNKEGFFEYATQSKEGDLSLSGIRVSNVEKRSQKETELLQTLPKGLKYSKSQSQVMKSIWDIKDQEAQKSFPTTGERKLVCILMGFPDLPFTKTKADFEALFNQVGYTANEATGSVRDYYLENSWGQFDLTVTIAGPYTASYNMSYYGGNDSNENDSNPKVLAQEAVTKADADVNYKEFDNDGDNWVDGVYIIYAGYGEEAGGSEDAIWAHAWSFTTLQLDEVYLSRYSCSAELSGNEGTEMTAIGVICHEFGHVLGAPDYYDTDYEGSGGSYSGTGKWDMMAGGSWNNMGKTPAHHNGFTKTVVYNWAPLTEIDTSAHITMNKVIADKNSFHKINTETAGEYFLLEYRTKDGFDAALPGQGLMIYHVHKDVWNSENAINAAHPQKMYPICANATQNPSAIANSYGSINSSGAPFPGSGLVTEFSAESVPTMMSWDGKKVEKSITNITEDLTLETIEFDFMGGLYGNPGLFKAVTYSTTQIELSWIKSEKRTVIVGVSESPIATNINTGESIAIDQMLDEQTKIIYIGTDDNAIITDLNPATKYYFKAWTVLDNTPTYSPGVLSSASTGCAEVTTLPFTEDFETSFITSCWSQIHVSNNKNWEWGTGNNAGYPANAHSGQKNAYFKITTASSKGSISRIVLPTFDLTAYAQKNVSLDFWMANAKWDTDQDVLKVYYKTPSKDWTLLQTFRNDITAWTKKTIQLPERVQGLQIAFEATANFGRGVCIDDIQLLEGSPVSTPTNDLEKASIYPNPFSNEINIENLVSAQKVKVVNLLGQTLIEQQANNQTNLRVNTSNLAAGIYLIVIEGNNGLRTVNKLVKE